jgi:hypothetical protein
MDGVKYILSKRLSLCSAAPFRSADTEREQQSNKKQDLGSQIISARRGGRYFKLAQ